MQKGRRIDKRLLPVCILSAALLLGFFAFWYSDIGDTLDNSVMLAKAAVGGHLTDYYAYAAAHMSAQTVYSANYHVLVYAVFAVWNLPTVILHMLTGFEYMNSTAALLWCKLLVVGGLAGMCAAVYRLTRLLSPRAGAPRTACFLLCSSLAVFIPAFVACQYDCLALVCMLFGMYFYAQRKNRCFLLLFAAAMPFKLFALFVLLPMLLLRYKNFLKILLMTAAVCLPSWLLSLPFRGDVYYTAAMGSQNGDALSLLLGAAVSVGGVQINLFLAAYLVICFACYLRREADAAAEARFALYAALSVFAAFTVLVPIRSYWLILYAPFAAVLCAAAPQNRLPAILAETLAGVSGGWYMLAHHWIYNTGHICWMKDGFADGTTARYGHFRGLLEAFGLSELPTFLFAVCTGAFVCMLWCLYPRAADGKGTKEKGMTAVRWTRVLSIALTGILLIYCAVAAQPAVCFGSDRVDSYTADTEPLTEEESLSCQLSFDTEKALTELGLYLQPSKHSRASRSLLQITLTDTEDGSVIWEGAAGIALLRSDQFLKFSLRGVTVQPHRRYRLDIALVYPERARGVQAYPCRSADGTPAVYIR